jgi:hypothetical protein
MGWHWNLGAARLWGGAARKVVIVSMCWQLRTSEEVRVYVVLVLNAHVDLVLGEHCVVEGLHNRLHEVNWRSPTIDANIPPKDSIGSRQVHHFSSLSFRTSPFSSRSHRNPRPSSTYQSCQGTLISLDQIIILLAYRRHL